MGGAKPPAGGQGRDVGDTDRAGLVHTINLCRFPPLPTRVLIEVGDKRRQLQRPAWARVTLPLPRLLHTCLLLIHMPCPFHGPQVSIEVGDKRRQLQWPPWSHAGVRALGQRCMSARPKDRPTAQQLLQELTALMQAVPQYA